MFCRLAVIVILGLLATSLPNKGFAAGPPKYAILTNGPTCSIKIENTSIKSFRLLATSDQIDKLASKGLVTVDVCECYLMPGNAQKCMLDQVRKTEFVQALKQDEVDLLAGKNVSFRRKPRRLCRVVHGSSNTFFHRRARIGVPSRPAKPCCLPVHCTAAICPPSAGASPAAESRRRSKLRGCEAKPRLRGRTADLRKTQKSSGGRIENSRRVRNQALSRADVHV